MIVTPACVLFDLDHTLSGYDHDLRVQVLAQRVGVTPERIETELFASGLEHDCDRGLYSTQGQVDELARRLGVAVTVQDCVIARATSMTPFPEMIELVRELSGRATLAILTNNGFLVRDNFAAICPVYADAFAGRFHCSAEFGLLKPDPATFAACAQKLGLAPERIFFSDDVAANAEGALAASMQAQQYQGASKLRATLVETGLLPG
ncbi:MAG: HAD hydrolase-like protein [Proteobacteria bacterium]|nr:HAD hydrolase-like protein [Pseudomonadota bacterium]